MSEACKNFDRASELQKSGQTELEPQLQETVDMSQSTCFQEMCGFVQSDLDCTSEERDRMDRILSDQCNEIPTWSVGTWGPAKNGGVKFSMR